MAHVEVLNRQITSCCTSSLLECSPAMKEFVGKNEGRDMPVSDERMEMTLVKFLHSGGPDVIHFSDLKVPDIQGTELVSAIQVKVETYWHVSLGLL